MPVDRGSGHEACRLGAQPRHRITDVDALSEARQRQGVAERISGRVLAIDIADAEAAATTVATIAASGSGGSTPTTCKPARANGCYGCTTLLDLNFC